MMYENAFLVLAGSLHILLIGKNVSHKIGEAAHLELFMHLIDELQV
jgi:hypothetical protein